MKKKLIPKRNQGFSLIELVIVIAIMAILVALIAPSFVRYIEKSRRTYDCDTAAKMREALDRIAIDEEVTQIYSTEVSFHGEDAANANSNVSYDIMLEDMGGTAPVSRLDKDYLWTLHFDDKGVVDEMYLGPESTPKRHQLYPDNEAFLNMAD